MKLDYSKKTDRQLRAIYHNNAPRTIAAYLHPEVATSKHRSAYAEQQKRRVALKVKRAELASS